MASRQLRIAILSGKGGAGKTLVSVNLASVAGQAMYIDCDVEEPNGHLFFRPTDLIKKDVCVGVPRVDQSMCYGCRKCVDFCQFNALVYVGGKLKILEELCHSCGGCMLVCPQKALTETDIKIGEIVEGVSNQVAVVSGILNEGETSVLSGHVDVTKLSPDVRHTIFFDIRLPRILAALIIGSSLAVSGHVVQILLNNPLASASTLGTSSGAAFGATLALYFTVIIGIPLPSELFAVLFAVLSLIIVIKLSSKNGHYHTTNVVLSGVIISTILSSAITFIKYLADEEVYVIVSFLMGSLSGKHLNEVLIYGVIMMGVMIIIYQFKTQLNIMMLGRQEALITGVEYDKVFRIMIVLSSILVALSVSLVGIIGFLGLVVPHIGRMLIGSDNKKSMIVIGLIGALFLLVADTISRAYLPSQVPAGVITTIIGGSFFIYLFNKRKV